MLAEREFNALLLQYMPYIRLRVFRSGIEDREDVVQDICMTACAKRANYDPSRGAFVNWLYWTIRSRLQELAIHKRKRASLNKQMEYFEEDGEPRFHAISLEGDPHMSLELRETLDAVSELKPREAYVVMQRAIGVGVDEIGATFNASGQYAQQLHALGMRKLRKKMGRKEAA